MTQRIQRRRLDGEADVSPASTLPKVFPGDPAVPATEEDKKNWNGFCEIESEPVLQS